MLGLYLLFYFMLINQFCFNISTYYEMIGYLGSKNNLLITLVWLYFYRYVQNREFFFKAWSLPPLIFIFNGIYDDIYQNSFIWESKLTNTQLLNGLMLLHPAILYFYYVSYFYGSKSKVLKKFLKKNKFFKTPSVFVTGAKYSYLSLILGCWWAEQELVWGGWWNWDFVELIALNLLILSLVFIHSETSYYGNSGSWYTTLTLTFILLASITLIRFNLINSVHNFITSNTHKQHLYYIILLILILPITSTFLNQLNLSTSLSVNNFLIISILAFFAVIIYYVSLPNILTTNYSIQASFDNLWLNSVLIFTILNFFKKINQKYNLQLLRVSFILSIYWIFLTKSLFLNLLITVIFISLVYTYNTNHKQYLHSFSIIHILLLILIFFTKKQTFVFDNNTNNFLNFVGNTFKINNIYIFYNLGLDLIDYNPFIKFFINSNKSDLVEGLYKNIFEKTTLLKNNFIFEMYSFNLQKLYQLIGFVTTQVFIFILLFLSYIFIRCKSISI